MYLEKSLSCLCYNFCGILRIAKDVDAIFFYRAELSVYTYTVTVWKNGFTVDDSELITLDDPEDAAFLEVTIFNIVFANFKSFSVVDSP